FDKIENGSQLLARSGAVSVVLTALTCDQTAGIVLPLKMLRRKGPDFGVTPAMSVRTISDTGTIIAPLMPWNINALIIIGITGIGAVSYAPYAVLCAIAPLVHLVYLKLRPVKMEP
ncbi:sodium:proton antiporter, partial [Aduncisulcus paluster]